MKVKGSQGDAGGGQEPEPEGNQHATTPPPTNVGIGAYPHQELDRLRNENAGYRRKLRDAEKAAENATKANDQLKEQLLSKSLVAAVRGYDLTETQRKRILKSARADLEVEWGEDGVTFKADVDNTVKTVLDELGLLPADPEGGEQPKETQQAQTPAAPPPQPQQPQQQFSQQPPQQTFGWMGARPNNGQGVPVQPHPQSPSEYAAQQLARRREENAG